MFKTRKKEIQKRLGPDGCEEPPDQSGSSKENPRNYNDQSNQQVCLKILNSPQSHNQCYPSFFNLRGYRGSDTSAYLYLTTVCSPQRIYFTLI